MKKLTLCLLLALTNVFAARMVLNTNGTESVRLLAPSDRLAFNEDWSKIIHTAEGADPDTISLQYVNRVTLDTLMGALEEFYVNTDDGTDTLDFTEIDRIFFIIGEPDTTTDSDDDGISDYDERYRYGTNPKSANTDGDLYSDYEEIFEFGTLFPLVAELPEMTIELTSYPQVIFNYTYTTDNTTTTEVVESSTQTTSSTETRTSETAYSHEHGWEASVGMEQTVQVGTTNQTGWGWNWSVSVHGTYSKSKTKSVGSENSREYAKGVERAESRQSSEGVQLDGAILTADFSLRNTGEFAYDITNLTLSLVLEDRGTISAINSIPTDISAHNKVTLNPGAEAAISATLDLNVAQANDIARQIANADYLYGRIGTYNIEYNDGSVNEATTQTNANCATVIVDFGPGSNIDPINRKVSALVNYNPYGSLDFSPLLLKEALEAIQREYKTKTGLGPTFWWQIDTYQDSVGLVAMGMDADSVRNDPENNAWWYIVHQRAATDTVLGYTLKRNSVYPDTIPIGFQDIIHLAYSKDADNDSISHYEEALYGTDDNDADSDDDGLSDYEEIRGWEYVDGTDTLVFQTDPLRADTDGDGVNDPDDSDPLRRPSEVPSANPSLDTIYVVVGADTLAKTTSAIATDTVRLDLPSDATTATLLLRTQDVVDRIALHRLNGMWESVDTSASSALVWESAVEFPGVLNRYEVIVTAEDCETMDTIILEIRSPLPNDTRIEAIDFSSTEPWKRIDMTVDNGDQTDPRTSGILLLRSTSQTALEDLVLEDGNNNVHTVGHVYSVGGADVILVRDGAPSLSSEAVSNGALDAGTTYYYRQYPYHTDPQSRHWYAAGSTIANARTRRVALTVNLHRYEVIDEADGVGACEIDYRMRFVHTSASGVDESTVYGDRVEGLGDGDKVWPDDTRTIYLRKGDQISFRLKFWEDDGSMSSNDYLWGSEGGYDEIRAYSQEYIAARAMNGGNSWDYHRTCASSSNCTFGDYYRKVFYRTREAANTEVEIKFYFEATIKD